MNSKAIRVALVEVVVFLFSVSVAATFPASAIATVDNFGVEDASGYKNTNVLVPVNITNVHSESIVGIEFKFLYDKSVINLVGMQKGTLTSTWSDPLKTCAEGGYVIGIVGTLAKTIANGSIGSVVVLNFTTIGESGETSRMHLSNIKLVNTTFDETGTAPAKNGTFTILTISRPTPSPSPLPIEPPAGDGGEAIAPSDTDGDDILETDGVVSTSTPSVLVTPTTSPLIIPLPTPSPSLTPTPSGFEAIFAIAELLTVAYLVRRRKK